MSLRTCSLFHLEINQRLFSGTFATYFTLHIAQVPWEVLMEYLLGLCFDENISYCSHERDFYDFKNISLLLHLDFSSEKVFPPGGE